MSFFTSTYLNIMKIGYELCKNTKEVRDGSQTYVTKFLNRYVLSSALVTFIVKSRHIDIFSHPSSSHLFFLHLDIIKIVQELCKNAWDIQDRFSAYINDKVCKQILSPVQLNLVLVNFLGRKKCSLTPRCSLSIRCIVFEMSFKETKKVHFIMQVLLLNIKLSSFVLQNCFILDISIKVLKT